LPQALLVAADEVIAQVCDERVLATVHMSLPWLADTG